MCDSIEQVVDWHALYLRKNFGNPSSQLKAFVEMLANSPEAARAEAVIFSWLHQMGLNPRVHQKAGTGGMDFKCHPSVGGEFLVEVTSFGELALASASNLSSDLDDLSGGAYRMVTPELKARIGDKMDQLSRGGPLPRLLMITSEHPKADLVFNRMGAKYLLVSDPKLSIPFADPPRPPVSSSPRWVTDLKDSIFFEPDKRDPDKIVPCRQSASAVVLVPILAHEIRPVGVVHPDPSVPFDIKTLPQVPLLRVIDWPIKEGIVKPEWTLPTDPPYPKHKSVGA